MVAKRAAGVAGSAAGSAAGGFLNNPGALAAIGIIVTIVTTLLVFRKDITNFLAGLKFPEFPEINIPGLPDITFPTFEFPDITFPDFPTFEFPDITFPDFPTFEFPTFEFPDIFGGGGGGDPDLPPGFQPNPEFEDDPTMFNPPGVTGFGLPESPEGVPIPGFGDVPEIETDIPGEFVGGGVGFEGGFIFETPTEPFEITESTTLSEIIAAGLATSASGAANIKFEALEFPSSTFDFGTNTNIEGA